MSASSPKRALISVTDKTGVVELARGLTALGYEIVSTGGTRALLTREGVPALDVEAVTGSPEMLGGRVKTLHPAIHGGILAVRGDAEHERALAARKIAPIDVVVVNLYAFEQAAARAKFPADEVVEEIDIGGPTLLRAAAKNCAHVVVVVDPREYGRVLEELRAGAVTIERRRALALQVFRHTAAYDAAIVAWMESSQDASLPDRLSLRAERAMTLRYGENPHQLGALYADAGPRREGALVGAEQLGGKELSYNNLLDADSALGLLLDLRGAVGEHVAVYVKHNNPCGAAAQRTLAGAIEVAQKVDPVSAFGAVIALSSPVDRAAAVVLSELFAEVVLAPSFDEGALEVLRQKKNLRLLSLGPLGRPDADGIELRRVRGGYLAQTADARPDVGAELAGAKQVSRRAPSEAERRALTFSWIVAKHVRSNAIVFGHADRVVAVGAGQMSRVDSVAICRHKAGDRLRGAVVASDAFFPFRDGVDLLAEAGATAIVQPGGSVRDAEVIAAADERELAMIFTGVRHFRH